MTYMGTGDPARRRTDYYPAWLDKLADYVTLEASAMNGAAQGAHAVRAIVLGVKSLYDYQELSFHGDYRHARKLRPGRPRCRETRRSESLVPIPPGP
jgi:hypothetical protein